jgi:DNA-binding transcriptional MerR regulator
MKDLCERTGLPRQAIHFYIQQGLVPEGEKSGRNMAFYGDEHVSRIKLVRQLQEERFLPLKAIRAVLGESQDRFTPAQRSMLLEVKERMGEAMPAPQSRYVDARELSKKSGVTPADLRQMISLGVVAGIEEGRGQNKTLRIAESDAWIVELWGEMRRAGFSEKLGFTPKDLAVIEEKLGELFDWETSTLAHRLEAIDPGVVSEMIQRALPILGTLLVRAHERKVRTFFAQIGDSE